MQPLLPVAAGRRIHGLGPIPVIAAQRCLPTLRLVYGCLQTFTGTALRHSPSMTFRMTAAQASEMALPTRTGRSIHTSAAQ
jgi:hypothetical protein